MTLVSQEDENGNCPTCGKSMRLSPEMQAALDVQESDTKPVVSQNAPETIWAWVEETNVRDGNSTTRGEERKWSESLLTGIVGVLGAKRYTDADIADARIAELEHEISSWKGFVGTLANLVPLPEVVKVTGTLGDFAEWIKEKVIRVAELESATTWDHAEFAKRLATARNEALEDRNAVLTAAADFIRSNDINNVGMPWPEDGKTATKVLSYRRALKSEGEGSTIAGIKIATDESLPTDVIEARHPDGRVDRFIIKTPDTQEEKVGE